MGGAFPAPSLPLPPPFTSNPSLHTCLAGKLPYVKASSRTNPVLVCKVSHNCLTVKSRDHIHLQLNAEHIIQTRKVKNMIADRMTVISTTFDLTREKKQEDIQFRSCHVDRGPKPNYKMVFCSEHGMSFISSISKRCQRGQVLSRKKRRQLQRYLMMLKKIK